MAARWTALFVITAIISQSVAINYCDNSQQCSLTADSIVLNIAYMNPCGDTKMYPQINVNGTGLCNCSDIVSTITLTGKDGNEVTYAVIFTYTKVSETKTWTTNITVNVASGNIPTIDNSTSCGGQATAYLLQNTTYMGDNVAQQNGFQCSQATASSNGTTCGNVQYMNLTMVGWKIKPFTSTTNYQTCSPDVTSIVVPIAVGAALAGLVVLVIVVWIAGKLWEKYKAKKSGGGVSYDKL
ncbi:hypothetical protein EMCRGX_G026066 [Ephydatia muelleri]|eukprot:Em0021g818a